MTIHLINRDPEPNESGVPVDSRVFLELITDGDSIDNSKTSVWVNDVLAYTAGVIQPAFDGTGAAWSVPATNILRIDLRPLVTFSSEEEVTVRVVSQTTPTPSTATIDQSYSFQVEDVTAPRISSVVALSPMVLRVTFNEVMRATSASGSSDALNPSNYVFTALPDDGVPAVSVVAQSVLGQDGDTSFDVTTDIELSPGIAYSLDASGVADVSGNPVAAPFATLTFVAFNPPAPPDRDFDVLDLYPGMNLREDVTETLTRFGRCLQDVLTLLLYDIDRWPTILDPDIAPEAFVDAMLADLGNPFAFELSLNQKRKLVRILVAIYQRKGLGEGIEDVVRFFLGKVVSVVPCEADGWELGVSELGETTILGPGALATIYSFQVDAAEALTDDERTQIEKIAVFMKPVNMHLKQITEPTGSVTIDHWELGLSELGETTLLH